MAPEQAMSEAVDGRCDLYSLGAILYEMLTGRPPFDGNTVLELIDEHLTTPLPQMRQRAPSVFIPEPVEAIVRRLLAKRPEDRFPGARELQTALEQIVVPSPVPPPVPPPVAPPPTIQPPSAASAPAAPVPDPASLPSPGLARRGTVVALERPPGSFGYQLGQLHKSLPAPLSKVPLPLLLGMLLIFLVVMMVVPWLVR
jgi:serine/threonine-protein kinase